MDKRQLLEILEELHAQLGRAESVDEESRKLLRSLTDDIDRLLEQTGQAPQGRRKSIIDRLKKIALEFETDHPRLALTIGQLADALSNIGI